MRTLIVTYLCFCLGSLALAQDNEKPYTEMTIKELQAIDSKALPKAEKKRHKKALKAAKQAEKKRIKAEKKAEKVRIKAEKKRKKTEAKEKEKTLKAAEQRIAYLDSIYSGTRIIKDDFRSSIQVKGMAITKYDMETLGRLGSGGNINYLIRTFYNPSSNQITAQAYMTVKFTEAVENSIMQSRGISAEKYASRQGLWKDFHSAVMRGGTELNFRGIARHANNPCEYYCSFYEEFTVDLNINYLMAAIENKTSLDIRIISKKAGSMTVQIPYDYLLAYLLRLGQTDPQLAIYGIDASSIISKVIEHTEALIAEE